jgi:hypothetical protein
VYCLLDEKMDEMLRLIHACLFLCRFSA